jgi:hypothetical protein
MRLNVFAFSRIPFWVNILSYELNSCTVINKTDIVVAQNYTLFTQLLYFNIRTSIRPIFISIRTRMFFCGLTIIIMAVPPIVCDIFRHLTMPVRLPLKSFCPSVPRHETTRVILNEFLSFLLGMFANDY